MASDTLNIITMETASLPSGLEEDDKECDNPFACLEDDIEELEEKETVPDNC